MTCNVRSAVIYVFYLDFLNSFCAIASRFTHLTDCYIQCFLFFGLLFFLFLETHIASLILTYFKVTLGICALKA